MTQIKALFFDVGGTIFDWKNTAKRQITQLSTKKNLPIDADAFANEWRREMFKARAEVAHGNLPWMSADGMHLAALESMRERYPLLNEIDDLMSLVHDTWHQLDAFEGAAESINQLRTKYTVVVLTILSWQSIVSSSKLAGVQWDGILSCEFLGYYKPSRQAYLKGIGLLGLTPDESMMVAAHETDLAAAQSAGLHAAYVGVPEEDIVFAGSTQQPTYAFDYTAVDFPDLCRQLGV
ncbi:MAG: HAD family hydrolase [Chloroflexota bacterium]